MYVVNLDFAYPEHQIKYILLKSFYIKVTIDRVL